MNTRALAFSCFLALLCSCSTLPKWSDDYSARPPLPAEALINEGARDGDRLYLPISLETGEKLLFMVDTGMPFTVLDKSLESKLGKHLGTSKFNYTWFGKTTVEVYEAPKLYLGDTQLLINDVVLTDDLNKLPIGQPVMGILGLDCLRHYCIQLDFDAGKIRFFDPSSLKTNGLGKAFPISISHHAGFIRATMFGLKNEWLSIDTGCPADIALKPKLIQQKLQQKPWWISEQKRATGVPVHTFYFNKIVFGDNVYRHFEVCDNPDDNLLGLRFMARHLITLDFPEGMMYFQHRNEDTFAGAEDLTIEALQFFSNLGEKDQLPGYVKNEHGDVSFLMSHENNPEVYPVPRTFNITKHNDTSKYHYTVVKTSKDGEWKLQKVWQTDADDHIIKEYPIP